MRHAPAIAGIALGVSLLTACGGGSDTESYCDDLKADKSYFESLDEGDATQFDEAISKFHDLAEKAPEEVKDEWETLDGALNGMTDALDEAGLTFEDLAAAESGQLPEGVTVEDLESLGPKLEELDSDEVNDASDAIEKHAKDECDVDLGS